MIKKIIVCFLTVIITSSQVSCLQAAFGQELQDQQVCNVPEAQENSGVPDIIDIFGGISNDDLFEHIDVAEQRGDLTYSQKLQLAIAYLKACTVQEIKEHITEHLQANYKHYLVAASVSTLFVATVLVCDALESATKSKRSKKLKN
jgi:hypothetical protein